MTIPGEGDFAVVATSGFAAKVIRWVTRSPVNHAILSVGHGMIVEAAPSGVQLRSASKYPDAIWAHWPLNTLESQHVGQWGRTHLNTRYAWLDDAEIGVVDMLKRVRGGRGLAWLVGVLCYPMLKSKRWLECAQLVDVAYQASGVQLFADGRPAGAVSPADLYQLIQARVTSR